VLQDTLFSSEFACVVIYVIYVGGQNIVLAEIGLLREKGA